MDAATSLSPKTAHLAVFSLPQCQPDLRDFLRYDILSSNTAPWRGVHVQSVGPGLPVPRCRNPSLVTSSATTFGPDHRFLTRHPARAFLARATSPGETVCKLLHNRTVGAIVCKLLLPGCSATQANRTVRVQDRRLYRTSPCFRLPGMWPFSFGSSPIGTVPSADVKTPLESCPPKTCASLFGAWCHTVLLATTKLPLDLPLPLQQETTQHSNHTVRDLTRGAQVNHSRAIQKWQVEGVWFVGHSNPAAVTSIGLSVFRPPCVLLRENCTNIQTLFKNWKTLFKTCGAMS